MSTTKSKRWFKGCEERLRVYKLVCKLANKRGDDTLPTEDVIDLAQALKYMMEDLFTPDSLQDD